MARNFIVQDDFIIRPLADENDKILKVGTNGITEVTAFTETEVVSLSASVAFIEGDYASTTYVNTQIGGLQTQINAISGSYATVSYVDAGDAANASNIGVNAAGIASNASDINTINTVTIPGLASDIAANASNIGVNAAAIAANASDIAQLFVDVTGISAESDLNDAFLQAQIDAISGSIGDGLTGSGVANQVAYWTDTEELAGNSNFTYVPGVGLTVGDDVTINGNLYVNGSEFIVNTETVSAYDNIIEINAGEPGIGVTKGYAGIRVDRGQLDDYFFVFDEMRDGFVIGVANTSAGETSELDQTQMVATREDTPTDQYIAYWNASQNRFDTVGGLSISVIATTTDITNLQNQIDDNASNIVVNAAGIASNASDINTINTVTIPGLASDIAANASNISQLFVDVAGISAESDLNDAFLQAQIDSLSGADLNFVKIAGDTMTGALVWNINNVETTRNNGSDLSVTGNNEVIDTIPYNNTFGSAEWLVNVNDGSDVRTSRIQAVWDNSNGFDWNEYVTEIQNNATNDLDLKVDITGGNIRLLASASAGTWTVKATRISIV